MTTKLICFCFYLLSTDKCLASAAEHLLHEQQLHQVSNKLLSEATDLKLNPTKDDDVVYDETSKSTNFNKNETETSKNNIPIATNSQGEPRTDIHEKRKWGQNSMATWGKRTSIPAISYTTNGHLKESTERPEKWKRSASLESLNSGEEGNRDEGETVG